MDNKEYRDDMKIKYGVSVSTLTRYGRKTIEVLFKTREMKCAWCGELEDLTIHHKDNLGINMYKAKLKKKMNNNIDNLEIVCRKCHGGYHAKTRKVQRGKNK